MWDTPKQKLNLFNEKGFTFRKEFHKASLPSALECLAAELCKVSAREFVQWKNEPRPFLSTNRYDRAMAFAFKVNIAALTHSGDVLEAKRELEGKPRVPRVEWWKKSYYAR